MRLSLKFQQLLSVQSSALGDDHARTCDRLQNVSLKFLIVAVLIPSKHIYVLHSLIVDCKVTF